MMSGGECQIWWARPRDAHSAHQEWFTADERARAQRYRRQIDRDRFAVGCALTRSVLAELTGLAPAALPLRRDCACGQPHGRPRLEGDPWHLSVTHSGGHVALAVTAAGPVGLDVERLEAHSHPPIRWVLTPAETTDWNTRHAQQRPATFLTYWVRKEAILKATGTGLRTPMTTIQVSNPGTPATVLSAPPGTGSIHLTDVDVDAEHLGAVAVIAPVIPTLHHYDGTALLHSQRDRQKNAVRGPA